MHASNDLVASRANYGGINASRWGDLNAEIRRLPNLGEQVAGLEHRLGGNTAPVEAGSANFRLLNECHALAELRRAEGGGVATRSTAEYEEIVVGHA